jgi:opacity protein-like surface antigen
MKKTLALLIASIALLATSRTLAANLCGVIPYVGADAELRHMNFYKPFGNDLLSHHYGQGNLYLGLQLNEYLAVEAGYEATEKKTRAGGDTAGNNTFQSNSRGQIKALHANLVGSLSICEQYRLKLIGLIGFARLKEKLVVVDTTVNGVVVPAANNTFTFKNKKSVLRLGAGLQHMINCNWGTRAMLKWEQSGKLNTRAQEDNNFPIRAKNSFIYSVGVFYMFN